VLEVGIVAGCTTVGEGEALLCVVAAAALLQVGRLAVTEGGIRMAVIVGQAAEDEELDELACLSLVLGGQLGRRGCVAEGSNLRRECVRLLDEQVQGTGQSRIQLLDVLLADSIVVVDVIAREGHFCLL